jgi:hypothetical protein
MTINLNYTRYNFLFHSSTFTWVGHDKRALEVLPQDFSLDAARLNIPEFCAASRYCTNVRIVGPQNVMLLIIAELNNSFNSDEELK